MSLTLNPASSPLSLLPIGRAHSSLLLTAVLSITLSPFPIGGAKQGVALLASYWRNLKAGSALIGRGSAYSRPLREGLAEPLFVLWGPRREGPEVPEGASPEGPGAFRGQHRAPRAGGHRAEPAGATPGRARGAEGGTPPGWDLGRGVRT